MCYCSRGKAVIECQLALQSPFQRHHVENLGSMQAMGALSDMFFIVVTCSGYLSRKVLQTRKLARPYSR
jgi:hypothetical protein